MSSTPADRIRAFISYSHQDRAYLEDLQKHLTYFERNGLLDLWVDTKIQPGQRWFDEIQHGLTTACAAIFLVSATFLASEFIQREELPALLKAAEQEQVTLLVVVLDACDFASSPLAPYQAIHDPKMPLNTLSASERTKIWTRLAGHVRKALPPTREARPRNYVPSSPTSHFHERPGEFETLESMLFQRAEPVRLGLVGIVGMGGVGKTALAVQLAYRDQDLFPDGMFWMLATGTLFDWQQRLAELAVRTGYLPPDDAPGQSDNDLRRARHLATYLATHPGALLILDNVEQPSLVITAWNALIGRQPECTLLYTSRVPTTPDGSVRLHRVEALSEEAALHLVLEGVRPEVLQQALAGEDSAEVKAARVLCNGVGFLPLGLVHLRRQLENNTLLSLAGLEQGVRELGTLNIASTDYPDAPALFATFAYSWKQVRDARAKRLFSLAGYFPEAVPISLWLLGMAAGLGERWDSFGQLSEARLALELQSLLEPLAEGEVRLHPLLREFAQSVRVLPAAKRKKLTQDAGERLAAELTNLNRLEARARSLGYWGCLGQVRAALAFADLLGARDWRASLARMERYLDRESHLLANGEWWPEPHPQFFFQQVYNRSVDEGQRLPTTHAPARWVRLERAVGAEDPALLRVLAGHTSNVTSVAFSPDGKRVLTGSDDETARLWDAETGAALHVLAGHTSYVKSVAFSPDGKRVLTGSWDETARLWDAETGALLHVLAGHTSYVTSVAFSPDGKRLLTGSGESFDPKDDTARLWDAESGAQQCVLKGHTDKVTSVAFSPDGKRVLTGSEDRTARLWDAETGASSRVLAGHTREVRSVAFSPDGRRLITGSGDQTARLWDIETEQELRVLEGHTSSVWDVAFSPDGKRLVTGSLDGTVRLWDAETGATQRMLEGYTLGVWSVAFSPDGRQLLIGLGGDKARLWDAETGALLQVLKGHTHIVTSVAFSPNGTRLLTGSYDGTVRLWDAGTGAALRVLEGHAYQVLSVAFSPDGTRLLTGSDDDTARLWDAETGAELRVLKGHAYQVLSVAFSPDGRLIVTAERAGWVRLWTGAGAEEGKLLGVYKAAYPVEAIHWLDDSRLLLADDGGPRYKPNIYQLKLEGM